MKRVLKWFGFLAAAGTAAGVVAAYVLKNKKEDSSGKVQDFTEDEDYDLDADLKPAVEREYVSLNGRPDTAEKPSDSEGGEKSEQNAGKI